jgi:hypothetical protein
MLKKRESREVFKRNFVFEFSTKLGNSYKLELLAENESQALFYLQHDLFEITGDVGEAYSETNGQEKTEKKAITFSKPETKKVIKDFKVVKPVQELVDTQMGVVINHPKRVNNPGFQPKHSTYREPVD